MRRSYASYFDTENYCLFANGEVSIRFNGKNDKVVLEYFIIHNKHKQSYRKKKIAHLRSHQTLLQRI